MLIPLVDCQEVGGGPVGQVLLEPGGKQRRHPWSGVAWIWARERRPPMCPRSGAPRRGRPAGSLPLSVLREFVPPEPARMDASATVLRLARVLAQLMAPPR
jgi:hypothetical protein